MKKMFFLLVVILLLSCATQEKETNGLDSQDDKTLALQSLPHENTSPAQDKNPDLEEIDFAKVELNETPEDYEKLKEYEGEWFLVRDGTIDEEDFFEIFYDGKSHRYRKNGSEPSMPVVVKETVGVDLLRNHPFPYYISGIKAKNKTKTMVVHDGESFKDYQLGKIYLGEEEGDGIINENELLKKCEGKWYLLRDGVMDKRDLFEIFFDGESYKYRRSWTKIGQPVKPSEPRDVIVRDGFVELLKRPPFPPYTIITMSEEDGKTFILIDDEGPLGYYQKETDEISELQQVQAE